MSYASKKPVFIASLLLVGVIVVLAFISSEQPAITQQPTTKMPVTVVTAEPSQVVITLRVTGITAPRWPLDVQSVTTGQVDYLDPEIEPGVLVDSGQVLLKVDPQHWLTEAEQAASRVANASLTLARQKHEQTVALKQLSKQKGTAFARREPQVAAASAELAAAQQALNSALKRVEDTQVKAPFSAVVLDRLVVPGQEVQAGDTLFRLAASDSVDVLVSLSEQVWKQLSGQAPDQLIYVYDRQQNRWPASVRYISPLFDSITRQRQLVLSVLNPYSPAAADQLLPDQQVSVELDLPAQNHVVRLRLSALTPDGEVWSLTKNNTLRLEPVRLLQQRGGQVWLQFQRDTGEARSVVLYPLLTMLEGQVVEPRVERVARHESIIL